MWPRLISGPMFIADAPYSVFAEPHIMKNFSRRSVRLAATLAAASTLLLVGLGCESKPLTIDGSKAPSFPATRPATLGPGDELEIKFYKTPELNSQQKVRADGMVTLQLIGDVQVAGMTPSDVTAAMLHDSYSQRDRFDQTRTMSGDRPRHLYSRRIFVTGEVMKPRPDRDGFQQAHASMEAIGDDGRLCPDRPRTSSR